MAEKSRVVDSKRNGERERGLALLPVLFRAVDAIKVTVDCAMLRERRRLHNRNKRKVVIIN
jgi:hypothetical protein